MSREPPRSSTNDHRYVKTRHPVRSAIYKHVIAGLVLRWVTTWESPVLFVLLFARPFPRGSPLLFLRHRTRFCMSDVDGRVAPGSPTWAIGDVLGLVSAALYS